MKGVCHDSTTSSVLAEEAAGGASRAQVGDEVAADSAQTAGRPLLLDDAWSALDGSNCSEGVVVREVHSAVLETVAALDG